MLRRLVSGSTTKKTRFHTARGERLPVREFPGMATAFIRRLSRQFQEGPWIAPRAVTFIERRLDDDSVVLELGAGRSTPWFAKRAGRVVSFESDDVWAERVYLQTACVRPRVEVRRIPAPSFDNAALSAFSEQSVDVLFVDQLEINPGDRVESIRRLWSLVRPGGIIVLDDSDRPAYASAFTALKGWPCHRFVGMKSTPFQATETVIFTRPLETS